MEAKIIDFKQPLESHIGMINKNQEIKTKDFKDTLKSVTKDIKKDEKTSEKLKDEVKSATKEEVDQGEELEKEDKILYENMVNLINIKGLVEPDLEINPEGIEIDELIPITLLSDEALESNEGMELDEDLINLINLTEKEENSEKLTKEESKEPTIKSQVINQIDKNDSKLPTEKMENSELKTENKDLDHNLEVNEEKNQITMETITGEETSNDSGDTSQESKADIESKYELINSTEKKTDMEVKNESFGPLIKDGIEFSREGLIEPESLIVEPKEVVEQIVDQVKFDISDGKNEMKLTLKPEALGEMTMNVELAKDGVIAKIMVDNYRTKEIIETNVFQLREGIKDTGMEIKTFEVFVGNGSDFDQHNFNGSNEFNLQKNSKKLRIKSENNKTVENYENGTVEDRKRNLEYTTEGGLNLFA